MTGSATLDAQLHESIYHNDIAARYLPKSHPQAQPCAVITGGQPGAGKSGITDIAKGRFLDTGHVLVDADKLRRFHPDFLDLMKSNDKLAANLTHPDCAKWSQRLMRDGVIGRRNLIVDQTSRDPVAMANLTQALKQAGYRVELHVIAAPANVSEQRIYERYEGMRDLDGFGRFSTKEKHDEAYVGVAKTVASVESGRQVDRLCIYNRNVRVVYDNSIESGQWQQEPLALKMLESERARPMTLPERQTYLDGFDKLAGMLARPERRASAEEIRTVETLRQQAKVSLAAEVFRRETPEKAMQKFPELASAYGYVRACEAKAEADGLNEAQRTVVMARVLENVAQRIERGDVPGVQIREEREAKSERQNDHQR